MGKEVSKAGEGNTNHSRLISGRHLKERMGREHRGRLHGAKTK